MCLRWTEDWDLRWFTPAAEVDLCGHATLGAAHAILTHRADAGVEGSAAKPTATWWMTSGHCTTSRLFSQKKRRHCHGMANEK